MYSHKLKKVKKTNLRNKRDVVNNTHGSYTKHSKHSNNSKHSKNSKNTKNSLKTNLRSLHKNTNIKNSKMSKFKHHAVLHGGASGTPTRNVEYTVNGDADMTTFSNLPDNKLIKINTLTINSCKSLIVLPENFGGLQALTKLKIYNCNSLTTVLPENFGGLQALTKFTISICENLTDLSESFGNLRALTELEISNCKNLRYLPVSIGNLKALTRITIIGCNGLTDLSVSFGSLQALKELSISYCHGLTSLPESFGGLKALTELKIDGCDNLRPLPDTIGLCFKLEKIRITNSNLLPPSVILLMPNITVKFERPEEMMLRCNDWFDEIEISTNPFYTIKIEKLIMWHIDNNSITHNMINQDTITALILGMKKISATKPLNNTKSAPVFPHVLEIMDTLNFYLQRPTTNTAKFLFQNKDKSIQAIVLECSDFNTFSSRIETDAEKYDVDDTKKFHANVNFFDDPVPIAVVPAAAADHAAAVEVAD